MSIFRDVGMKRGKLKNFDGNMQKMMVQIMRNLPRTEINDELVVYVKVLYDMSIDFPTVVSGFE